MHIREGVLDDIQSYGDKETMLRTLSRATQTAAAPLRPLRPAGLGHGIGVGVGVGRRHISLFDRVSNLISRRKDSASTAGSASPAEGEGAYPASVRDLGKEHAAATLDTSQATTVGRVRRRAVIGYDIGAVPRRALDAAVLGELQAALAGIEFGRSAGARGESIVDRTAAAQAVYDLTGRRIADTDLAQAADGADLVRRFARREKIEDGQRAAKRNGGLLAELRGRSWPANVHLG